MAVPANTIQTFAMVGIREDLSDTINIIDQFETPLYSKFKKGKCEMRTPEWLIDSRRAANAANAKIEGDDATNIVNIQPVRVKNVVQLFEGTVQVSDTSMAVKTAGRANEMDYMIAKEGLALKTDMETRISGNFASVLGAAGVAGQMAGIESWLTSNDNRGVGGVDGGYNTGTGLVVAATDGTQRPFTEALLKSTIQTCWLTGAKIPMVVLGAANKQTMSTFTGIAQNTNEVKSSDKVTIVGAADVYVSDYGRHMIIASRFTRNRTALLIDPEYWGMDFLQPFKRKKLATNGHNEREMLRAECTLKSLNQAMNGAVCDLN
jgi:hypothetical protein